MPNPNTIPTPSSLPYYFIEWSCRSSRLRVGRNPFDLENHHLVRHCCLQRKPSRLHASGRTTLLSIKTILTTVTVIVFLVLIAFDLRSYLESKPLSFLEQREFNNYVYDWISKGGRVVIFTRDMPWVHDQKRIEELLLAKARANELSICLPGRIPLADELEAHGARILRKRRLYRPGHQASQSR
jgi:hypothetical protein